MKYSREKTIHRFWNRCLRTGTIVGDALREMEQENDSALLQNREHPQALSGLNNMYVTGKDIDETILYLSEIVSNGINRALNPEG